MFYTKIMKTILVVSLFAQFFEKQYSNEFFSKRYKWLKHSSLTVHSKVFSNLPNAQPYFCLACFNQVLSGIFVLNPTGTKRPRQSNVNMQALLLFSISPLLCFARAHCEVFYYIFLSASIRCAFCETWWLGQFLYMGNIVPAQIHTRAAFFVFFYCFWEIEAGIWIFNEENPQKNPFRYFNSRKRLLHGVKNNIKTSKS